MARSCKKCFIYQLLQHVQFQKIGMSTSQLVETQYDVPFLHARCPLSSCVAAFGNQHIQIKFQRNHWEIHHINDHTGKFCQQQTDKTIACATYAAPVLGPYAKFALIHKKTQPFHKQTIRVIQEWLTHFLTGF